MPTQNIAGSIERAINGKRATRWFRNGYLGPFLVIFLTAAAVRVAMVEHYVSAIQQTPASLPFDSIEVGNIATNLAQGRGFSSPFGAGTQPTAWECPLVPFVFAALIKFAGGPTGFAAWSAYLLQAVVGGLGAAMYWVIVRRMMFLHPGLFSKWLSPAIAVVVCAWPESVYAVTHLWYFVFEDAVLALFALLAMRWWDNSDLQRGIAVGLSGGLLALINVTPLPIIGFAFLFPLFKKRPRGEILRSVGATVFLFGIIVAPWLIRNAVVFQTAVPLRSNTGYEIFQGNNAIECIREPEDAPHPATDKAERARYAELGEIRYCHQSLVRAWSYIRLHPGQTVRRTVERMYVTWLTDLTDRWNPEPAEKWWTLGWRMKVRHVVLNLLTLVAAAILLLGGFAGRFRLLPYAPLFAAILLALPLPHYFTLADPEYTMTLRMWMAVTALCLVALRASVSGNRAARTRSCE